MQVALPTADQVISLLATQIGTTEHPPGSNHVHYWPETGMKSLQGQPWCADFGCWGYLKSGGRLTWTTPRRMVSCPVLFSDAKRAHRVVTVPRRGDWVLFDFAGHRTPEHFETVVDARYWNAQGVIETIGGNTAPGAGAASAQSNGGGVYRRTRYHKNVFAFIRPDYDTSYHVAASPHPSQYIAPERPAALPMIKVVDAQLGCGSRLRPSRTVNLCQTALHRLGLDPGVVDGCWRRATQKAYDAFRVRTLGWSGSVAVGPTDVVSLSELGHRSRLFRLLGPVYHEVTAGESWASIAKGYATETDQLIALNRNRKPGALRIREVLRVG